MLTKRKTIILLIVIALFSIAGSLDAKQFSDSLDSYITLNLRVKDNLDTNKFNVFPKKSNSTKVGLVLSGGGARGLAQIGVLKV